MTTMIAFLLMLLLPVTQSWALPNTCKRIVGITIDYLRELRQPVAKCHIVYDVPLAQSFNHAVKDVTCQV